MNPRIFVVLGAAGFAVVIGIVALSGQTLISDLSEEGIFSGSSDSAKVMPIIIELKDLSIVEITERYAVLEIEFLV